MRKFDLPGRSPVLATSCIASTSHPLATGTALNVLREGGNAVDAAIAASATLCVVEPHMTGIGGDCFVTVCEADGTLHGLNGSGRAPMGIENGMFAGAAFSRLPDTSVHAITAPGAVRAWEKLHQRFGSMDFSRLFADSVHYAKEGFPVHARVARDWAVHRQKLAGNESASGKLLTNGRAPKAGALIKLPHLGNALEIVASSGADAFYTGPIAKDISSSVQKLGGYLNGYDLAEVTADWVEPVGVQFCGHEIFELPPNGQGLTALILLQLLSRESPAPEPESGARHFMEIELARLAYSVRDAYIADPATMTAEISDLLSGSHITALHKQFDRTCRNNSIKLPNPNDTDTIYLSVVDRDLLCVSFINSLYTGFGTGIVSEEFGIAMQNRGSCFVTEPGHPNEIAPGKRPMHTIIPGMAKRNGKPSICFGVMGGSYQPLGHAHVLSNMLQYDMDPQAALDDGRIFWDEDGVLIVESGIPDPVIGWMEERGFETQAGGPHGGGQIIQIDYDKGTLCAGSDPRKDGQAAGY